jgi:catechol 2,3-dioxygenase-like lactoylglutathione lyase family enzyme
MEQRLSFITLGVQNLLTMVAWYREKFGWIPFKDEDGICFFQLNGFVLGLYPVNELAEDAGVADDGSGFKRFSLSINFRSEKEVDEIAGELRAKGVRILREPEKVFWGGYRGYIADPEDNCWELAYNPYLIPNAQGNIIGV